MSSEQKQPLLSICIPTYNRAETLQEAVASILAQAAEVKAGDFEVLISDNASTDSTDAVIDKIKASTKLTVKYFKNEKNVGMDNNFQLLVGRALGRYIWLLGSDDLLAPGALKSVLRELEGEDQVDLYLGEKEDFYLTPDRPMRRRKIMPFVRAETFDFSRKEEVDRYFKANKKLIAYCNYISNIIFLREKWLRVRGKEEFTGTFYLHLYVFQALLWGGEPGTIKYLPAPLVKRRWGKEGTPELEQWKSLPFAELRLRQDVSIYRKVSSAVFEDKKYIRLIDELVIRNDGFSWAVRLRIENPRRFIGDILPFLFRVYWTHPMFWLKIVPLVFIPGFIWKLMRGVYRRQVKGEPIGLKEVLGI
ncbi:MAG: glycosyltransferase family 2 protein [Candidatus Saganbacteria bacterium]|nr:glycosyltransferase family 2 protein [Candidatus Saganbacteria bacterium]